MDATRRRRLSCRSASSILLLIAGLCAAPAAPLSAQQSRAEEIAQQQAEKSTRLRPNTPSGAERALDWFEDHFTDPDTLYLTFGDIYPSGGFAPGLAYRAAAGHARMNLGGAYSVRSYKLAHASIDFPELAGDKLAVETRVRWVDATQVPFYGLGIDSSRDDRVNYGLRTLEAGAAAAFKPVPWYRIGAGIGWRQVEDSAGEGTRPSIETRHSRQTAPGLFSEARYIETTAFTAIDLRESPGYTRRGGLYAVALNDVRDRDDALGFQRLDVDLRQYVPVLKEQWVFAFRGLVQTTLVEDGQVVPYHLLPSLGGAHTLRGYTDFRFQDKHLLLLGAEYRWLPRASSTWRSSSTRARSRGAAAISI